MKGLSLHDVSLPPHVLDLVLPAQECCTAVFATTTITKGSLLRNEIRFDFAPVALTLCQLNDWDPADVQEKMLEVALQDSTDSVFRVVHDVLLQESESVPLGSEEDDSTGDLVARPRTISALQLTVRLCNALCAKFDNCPEDVASRRALKQLVQTTSQLLTHLFEACCRRCRGMGSDVASKLHRMLMNGLDAAVHCRNERGFTDDATSEELQKEALEDASMVASLARGIAAMGQAIPSGVGPMPLKAKQLHWSSEAKTFGTVTATTNPPGAVQSRVVVGASTSRGNSKKQQQQGGGPATATLTVPPYATSAWEGFLVYVAGMLRPSIAARAIATLLTVHAAHSCSIVAPIGLPCYPMDTIGATGVHMSRSFRHPKGCATTTML